MPTRKVKAAQLRAIGKEVRNTSAAGILSTARANRNQVVSGIFWSSFSSIPPRSTAIKRNPPACKIMSAARNACSSGCSSVRSPFCFFEDFAGAHRTQSNRSRSTPAAAAEAGSKLSLASTSAQQFCSLVTCAITELSSAVRPLETALDAQISVRPLSGISIPAIPLESVLISRFGVGVSAAGMRCWRRASIWARKSGTDAIKTCEGCYNSSFIRLTDI